MLLLLLLVMVVQSFGTINRTLLILLSTDRRTDGAHSSVNFDVTDSVANFLQNDAKNTTEEEDNEEKKQNTKLRIGKTAFANKR